MNRFVNRLLASVRLLLVAAGMLLASAQAAAQCPAPELISGLRTPLGITQSNQNNLVVSETGTGELHTGRLSLVDLNGNRRTLLDGLPSAINDVNEPSGPAGLYMRGRTLYVVIGIGDSIRPGPSAGTAVGNPNPSSPLFSSILAINFSAEVEKTAGGFTLTPADQQTLADGGQVTLTNGDDRLTIRMIANSPNFTPNPLPFFSDNVRGSNPFGLVVVGDQIYVTDGGQNALRQVDIPTGAVSTLATFPPIPNPLFINPNPPPPSIGGPFVEAVPTGIRYADGQLLVTLFRGFPFPAGTSVVEQVEPVTGSHAPFISGLRTAIDVLPVSEGGDTDYLVLEHSSAGGPPLPPFANLGRLLRFETPGDAPTVVANCFNRPTSLALDKKTGTIYVTELAGRILAVPIS